MRKRAKTPRVVASALAVSEGSQGDKDAKQEQEKEKEQEQELEAKKEPAKVDILSISGDTDVWPSC